MKSEGFNIHSRPCYCSILAFFIRDFFCAYVFVKTGREIHSS